MRADTVLLHAAGSLRGALTDVAKAFEAETGGKVQAKYGASGLLKDEIAGGAKADVFASANMEHPQALARGEAQRAGRAVRAQPAVRAGAARARGHAGHAARPHARSGDQARHLDAEGRSIRRLRLRGVPQGRERSSPGASATLEKKALQLTGGPIQRGRRRRAARSMAR